MTKAERISNDALWMEAAALVRYAAGRLHKRYGSPGETIDEDMVQEGILAAGTALQSWDAAKGKLSTWILARAYGAMIDHYKREGNHGMAGKDVVVNVDDFDGPAATDDSDGQDLPGSGGDTVLTLADVTPYEVPPEGLELPEVAADKQLLRDALDALPKQQAAIIKTYFGIDRKPLSIEQMASLSEASESTLRRSLAYALDDLSAIINTGAQ